MTSVERLKQFKVYILDAQDRRAGQVDDFRSLKATKIFNEVGKWTLEIDRSSSSLVKLTTPMYGIDIYDHGSNQSFCRGLIDTRQQTYDATTDSLTITGWDDNQWLNWRLAHPSPGEGLPPYTVQAYDVRTGAATTVLRSYADVNLGPTAIGARQITTTAGTDGGGLGSTITGRARWEVLLPFLQNLALQSSPVVGFRIGRFNNVKQFQAFLPVDRSDSVKFSVALGNLIGGTIKSTSPKATYVFAAGSGDLTARVYHESYDAGVQATWGRREYFLDTNNTSVDAELAASGAAALIEQGEQAEFAVKITDTAGLQYGIDYNLGDIVTATFVGSESAPIIVGVGAGKVKEPITQVELNLSDSDMSIIPTIGTPTNATIFRIFREIRALRKQLKSRTNN